MRIVSLQGLQRGRRGFRARAHGSERGERHEEQGDVPRAVHQSGEL